MGQLLKNQFGVSHPLKLLLPSFNKFIHETHSKRVYRINVYLKEEHNSKTFPEAVICTLPLPTFLISMVELIKPEQPPGDTDLELLKVYLNLFKSSKLRNPSSPVIIS